MSRGNGARLRRKAKRQGVSLYVARALRSGVNPQAQVVNGAVNLPYAGLWKDQEGNMHCTRKRQRTRVSLRKQLHSLA